MSHSKNPQEKKDFNKMLQSTTAENKIFYKLFLNKLMRN